MLKNIFLDLLYNFNADTSVAMQYWSEIERQYSTAKRYYHNLAHISALIAFLQNYKSEIENWNALLFAVFYHDIVYNVLRHNNEEKSAALAIKRLESLGADAETIAICNMQILATKEHGISGKKDTDLFTDADLIILGQAPAIYKQYCQQIRMEYAVYPDLAYKPGRKKVLLDFLQMPRIYKTSVCYSLFENQARTNLENELQLL